MSRHLVASLVVLAFLGFLAWVLFGETESGASSEAGGPPQVAEEDRRPGSEEGAGGNPARGGSGREGTSTASRLESRPFASSDEPAPQPFLFRILEPDGAPAAAAFVRVAQGAVRRADGEGLVRWTRPRRETGVASSEQEAEGVALEALSSDGRASGEGRWPARPGEEGVLRLEPAGRLTLAVEVVGGTPAGCALMVLHHDEEVSREAVRFAPLVRAEARSRGHEVELTRNNGVKSGLRIAFAEDPVIELPIPWTPRFLVVPHGMDHEVSPRTVPVMGTRGARVAARFRARLSGFLQGAVIGLDEAPPPYRVSVTRFAVDGTGRGKMPGFPHQEPVWSTANLPVGPARVRVHVRDGAGRQHVSEIVPVEIRAGRHEDGPDIAVRAAPGVELEVRTHEGDLVREARVQAVVEEAHRVATGRSAPEVAPGVYLVQWETPGSRSVLVDVLGRESQEFGPFEVGPGAPNRHVVRLEPGRTVAGRVVDARGEPVFGARFRIESRSELRGSSRSGQLPEDRADFAFHGCRGDPVTLTLLGPVPDAGRRPRGVFSVTPELEPDFGREFRLEDVAEVSGTVRMESGTRSGVLVQLLDRNTGELRHEGRTRANGRFVIWVPESGHFEVRLAGPARLVGTKELHLPRERGRITVDLQAETVREAR